MWHQCSLAAKEGGLECTWVNNDDFTVLVSGGSRCCWVSMCTVWPSHSKWVSRAVNLHQILHETWTFLCGNFRWFRRLQLWATGDWQLHHDNACAHASCLLQRFIVKHHITWVTQLLYSPDLTPHDFWLFPKLKLPLMNYRNDPWKYSL